MTIKQFFRNVNRCSAKKLAQFFIKIFKLWQIANSSQVRCKNGR